MSGNKRSKSNLVLEAADKLRDLILEQKAGTQIGSLNEVAQTLGVGIVTVQQAARILEHEGLLAVKRGPGGGYYGARPDDATLERTFATYMRLHDIGYREAFDMTVLLDCEIIEAAAACTEDSVAVKIESLIGQLESSSSAKDCIQFEIDFRETLFEAVKRPLLELLAKVAMGLYQTNSDHTNLAEEINLQTWRQGRSRILQAILARDVDLAAFEAQRYRQIVRDWGVG